MFGKRFDLFTILGFTVRLDLSWLLLAGLVTASMASGFQQMPEAFPTRSAWIMGAAMAIGLFVSIVAHELTHSVVARLHGMRIKGITLFFLGGVAEMEDEPPTPWAEFTMAIVGPIASLVIAALLFGAVAVGHAATWPATLMAVLETLALMNVLLAVFNMVPAFPLDGGRVLRSVLWGFKQNLRWATRIASALGVGFGWLLIVGGLLGAFAWPREPRLLMWALIGFFLLNVARLPYEQLVMREALRGLPAVHFLEQDTARVPRWIPLSEFLQDFVYRHQHRVFPVVDEAALVGVISADSLKGVPKEEWPSRTVGELTVPVPPEWIANDQESAERALERMARAGLQQLFVIRDGQLVGVVRLSAIVKLIELRRDIEGA